MMMKQIVRDIIWSLENEPDRWRVSTHTWARDDGLEIWRANGPILNIEIYRPQEMGLSLYEKIALWLAIRRWRNSLTLEKFMRA